MYFKELRMRKETHSLESSLVLGEHYSWHHRKPRDQGGDDSPRNKSRVLRSRHTAWHTLYDALPAQEVMRLFAGDQEIYGDWIKKSELQQKINEGYANSTAKRIKRREAWQLLFGEMSLEEIVQEINTIWLDPDYAIVIEVVRIKSVRLYSSEMAAKYNHYRNG